MPIAPLTIRWAAALQVTFSADPPGARAAVARVPTYSIRARDPATSRWLRILERRIGISGYFAGKHGGVAGSYDAFRRKFL